MNEHEYKPGDKVTFAVSREHFVGSVDEGIYIAENCFNEEGEAEVLRERADGLGLYLVGAVHGCGTYITNDEYHAIEPRPEQCFCGLTPQTDRERMLCDALLRKCRGLPVEIEIDGEWMKSGNKTSVDINDSYRPAQKLPEIPWEWIDSCVEKVEITKDKDILFWFDNGKYDSQPYIVIDLTGVTLPVTVTRPE